ncbi:hypothetical protein C8J57DRAFT_1476383 [Mycena rebaudengoi]|nr:hypothetical protein C8J57DRAFT_1476383 [Mycena rebaudengoi]
MWTALLMPPPTLETTAACAIVPGPPHWQTGPCLPRPASHRLTHTPHLIGFPTPAVSVPSCLAPCLHASPMLLGPNLARDERCERLSSHPLQPQLRRRLPCLSYCAGYGRMALVCAAATAATRTRAPLLSPPGSRSLQSHPSLRKLGDPYAGGNGTGDGNASGGRLNWQRGPAPLSARRRPLSPPSHILRLSPPIGPQGESFRAGIREIHDEPAGAYPAPSSLPSLHADGVRWSKSPSARTAASCARRTRSARSRRCGSPWAGARYSRAGAESEAAQAATAPAPTKPERRAADAHGGVLLAALADRHSGSRARTVRGLLRTTTSCASSSSSPHPNQHQPQRAQSAPVPAQEARGGQYVLGAAEDAVGLRQSRDSYPLLRETGHIFIPPLRCRTRVRCLRELHRERNSPWSLESPIPQSLSSERTCSGVVCGIG